MADTDTPPQGEGTAGTGSSSGGTNPEQEKRLSDENARLRVKNRELGERLESLEGTVKKFSELGDFDTIRAALEANTGGGGKGPKGDPSEIATIRRELSELKNQLTSEREARTKAEQTAKTEKLNGTLSRIASDAKLVEPNTAIEILRNRAKVADDGQVVFTVKGDDGEREIIANADALREHKLLPGIYFPASGTPGSGGTGGGEVRTVVNREQVLDPKSYEANREQILNSKRAG